MADLAGRVAFFDGMCHLCDGSVSFLVARDKKGRLRFAPLQGATFRAVVAHHPELDGIDSFVLWEDGRVHVRSAAALRIVAALGGAWRLCAIALAIPPPLRDAAYNFVARRRYKWFGRRDTCRVPSAQERARFLE